VAVVAGTAIQGVAARLLMRGVLRRHPTAFLVTLERWGVTVPLADSQRTLRERIVAGLAAQGFGPDDPVVVVGHSQGGLAVLRYTLDHPAQVPAVVTVGIPWGGAALAATVNSAVRRFARRDVPALADMQPGSDFLEALRDDLAADEAVARRLVNIYSAHEGLIHPYVWAHVPLPGVRNVLIATMADYARHLRDHPDLPVDEHLEARVHHLEEMNEPMVRSVVWRTVDEVSGVLE
jgi:pimeloyl-ACP methyl ester carboxylesterase